MAKYKACIGLEMHCEISKTNTKVFSSARNEYTDLQNSNVKPVDMGFPGTLPVVNKEAIKKALIASMILGCKQPDYVYFERKNYYYPDLPKGFQITQETKPIPMGIYGNVEFEFNGELKSVRVDNIHLEEDSARLNHDNEYSLIDYNRAGVPLLELVTYPDIRSADEAVAFLEHMRSIYRYANISDADSKKGQIRCDVNISIMDIDADETDYANYGTKVEIKNVNSFGGVRDAINYEINRQIELKENGSYDEMEQQTRRWDEESGTTIHMRSKADAIDYKYFVEPNIPKYKLSESWLAEIRREIPMLPMARKEKYINELGLSEYDANIIIKEKDYADYFEECVKLGLNAKTAANWLTGQIIAYINKTEIEFKDFYLTPNYLNQIISELDKGTISSKQAKEIFSKSLEEKKEPKNYISKENAQISDVNELTVIIDKILDNNKEQVSAYKNGRSNLFDYFVGQVMKETRGKANPPMVKEILKEKLDN